MDSEIPWIENYQLSINKLQQLIYDECIKLDASPRQAELVSENVISLVNGDDFIREIIDNDNSSP